MTEQAPKAQSGIDLVIRDETLAHERRTIITPHQVAELTREGFKIGLVRWPERCFYDEQYVRAVEQRGNPANFTLIGRDERRDSPECARSIILGVKEIPREPPGSANFILNHTYVHFDHSYKGQYGSAERLARFAFGHLFMGDEDQGSLLLDHEYCTDEDGKRTHAFGQSAGYATAAMSVLFWAQKIKGSPVGLSTLSYDSKEQFFDLHADEIAQALHKNTAPPQTLILGSPRGRSANGVMNFLKDLNAHLPPAAQIRHTLWGREETAALITEQQGLKGIETFDLVFNCTYTERPCRAFATDSTAAARNGKLQVFGDVTCDATPDKNRMRFTNYRTTDFDMPLLEVGPNVYAVTVDHSPSLFPLEATIDISRQAYPHIKSLMHAKRSENGIPLDSPWARAVKAFEDNMQVPLYAYSLGSSLVSDDEAFVIDMNARERAEYIQGVRTEIERNIKLCLGELHPLRPREIRAFFYHVAMGILRVHEYVDLTKMPPDKKADAPFNGPDMSDEIESVEQILTEKFNIRSLVDSHEVAQLHALSRCLSAALQRPEIMHALGFSDFEQMEQSMLDENTPPNFSLFLMYVAEAKELAVSDLYPEEDAWQIERDYLNMKEALQKETSLPAWLYREIEEIVNNRPVDFSREPAPPPFVDDTVPGL